MPIPTGTHTLGPGHGTLSIMTKRTGAAAKAGHDLTIHVTSWKATLDVVQEPAWTLVVALSADAGSLRVREGKGGMQALGEDDKASIHKSIDDDVLKRQEIAFRSTEAQPSADGSRITVHGQLTLAGRTRPTEFDLEIGADGRLKGHAIVKQSDWVIKPYSTLFGALKVADEVELELDATLAPS